MRKKMLKLAVALAVLTGGFGLGVPTRPANAGPICLEICCDAGCTIVIHCVRIGGTCLCPECSNGIEGL